MPSFATWAKEAATGEADYLVDNRHLQSKSKGIAYRHSPGKKATKLAPFGSTVRGIPNGTEWLEVGDLLLPFRVDGLQVLIPVLANGEHLSSDDAAVRAEEVSHLPAWLLAETDAGSLPKRPEAEVGKAPPPVEIVQDHREFVRPVAAAVGEWYEVVAERAVIRSQPTLNAHIENIKNRGEFVELFEWDDKKEWRRCKDSWQAGWMLIKHAQFGHILELVDSKLLQSVVPMCEAVMTNDLIALKSWIAEVSHKHMQRLGHGSLTMAAARGYLDCFVVLLEAGANPELILRAGPNSPGFREPAATQALARAASGLDFEMRDFDVALTKLERPQQELAESLLEKAAEYLRRRAGGPSRMRDDSEDEAPKARNEVRHAAGEDEADTKNSGNGGLPPGGEYAEVISRRVAVRVAPETFAEIIAEFRQGDIAVLLEYDESSNWRKVKAKDTDDQYGWTLLSHRTLGDLWKVLDQPPKEGGRMQNRKGGDEDWDLVFGK